MFDLQDIYGRFVFYQDQMCMHKPLHCRAIRKATMLEDRHL